MDGSTGPWERRMEHGQGGRGGGAGGLKDARTLLPTSHSRARTTCLTAERVCRVLGSALGSQLGL